MTEKGVEGEAAQVRAFETLIQAQLSGVQGAQWGAGCWGRELVSLPLP